MINMFDIDTIGLAILFVGFPSLIAMYALGYKLGNMERRGKVKRVN